jgi:hypothetical protein
MKSTMNSFVEPRREWTAPELKKVDLKQITAPPNIWRLKVQVLSVRVSSVWPSLRTLIARADNWP